MSVLSLNSYWIGFDWIGDSTLLIRASLTLNQMSRDNGSMKKATTHQYDH